MKKTEIVCALLLNWVLLSSAFAQELKVLDVTYPVEALAAETRPALPFADSATANKAAPLKTIEPVAAAERAWEIELKDVTLATTLQRWAKEAGWQIRWDAGKHVMVEASDGLAGSFEDAVRDVLEAPGIAQSAYPLEVCFYPNNPPLARITRKGDQDKECK